MIYSDFAAHIRYKTKTNATTFLDADILRIANIHLERMADDIVKANEDILGMIYYTDLVADQREYALPEDVIKIKRIELKIDGEDWVKASEYDLQFHDDATDEDTITSKFSDDYPQYEIFQKSLFLYFGSSVSAVTEGIKLWAVMYPASMTDLASAVDMAVDPSTTSRGIPRQLHELLARRVIIEYKTSRDKPITLTESERNFDYDLKKAIAGMGNMNLDRDAMYSMPYDDGSRY